MLVINEVVTSGTSVKNVSCQHVYNLYSFIAPRLNWRGYSLILGILKTAPSGSQTLVLPQQIKTCSGVGLSRPCWRRNWGKGASALTLWSLDWTATWGRKMFSIDSCQLTSGPCHFSDMHTTERSEQRSVEFLSPNSLSTMAEIISTTRLYLL